MLQRMNRKFPDANFTVAQLKDREQRLKKDHNAVKTICGKSGFRWNNELQMTTCIGGVWDDLPKDLQKWRNKCFPYYDELYDLYDGMWCI